MSVENLSSLLSKLETVIDFDISTAVNFNEVIDNTQSNEILQNLKQKLKEQTLSLRQEIEQVEINQNKKLNSQQLLASFISPLPIAIAILDQEMCYVAVSDRWKINYQLEKSLIGLSINESFSNLPKDWQQKYQAC